MNSQTIKFIVLNRSMLDLVGTYFLYINDGKVCITILIMSFIFQTYRLPILPLFSLLFTPIFSFTSFLVFLKIVIFLDDCFQTFAGTCVGPYWIYSTIIKLYLYIYIVYLCLKRSGFLIRSCDKVIRYYSERVCNMLSDLELFICLNGLKYIFNDFVKGF